MKTTFLTVLLAARGGGAPLILRDVPAIQPSTLAELSALPKTNAVLPAAVTLTAAAPAVPAPERRAKAGALQSARSLARSLAFSAAYDGAKPGAAAIAPVPLGLSRPAPRPAARGEEDAPIPGPRPLQPSDIPGRTPLEKHAAFFDIDGDGIVTVSETATRLKQLGVKPLRAAFLATLIHVGLTGNTSAGWWDKLQLNIRVDKIHFGRHAADTGIYDARGGFSPAALHNLFARFSKSKKGFLNENELKLMLAHNARLRPGLFGEAAAKLEFDALLELAADGEDQASGRPLRAISLERMTQLYDGTLFYRLLGA